MYLTGNDINNLFGFIQVINDEKIAYDHSKIVFELMAMDKNWSENNLFEASLEIEENAYYDLDVNYSNFKSLFNFIFSMRKDKNILPYCIGKK